MLVQIITILTLLEPAGIHDAIFIEIIEFLIDLDPPCGPHAIIAEVISSFRSVQPPGRKDTVFFRRKIVGRTVNFLPAEQRVSLFGKITKSSILFRTPSAAVKYIIAKAKLGNSNGQSTKDNQHQDRAQDCLYSFLHKRASDSSDLICKV